MDRNPKNGSEKEQTGPPPASHDLRSGNVPATGTPFEPLTPPPPQPRFTQEEKESFAHAAFTTIRQHFTQALEQLSAQNSGFAASLTEPGDLVFTARVDAQGQRVTSCTISLVSPAALHYRGEGNLYRDVLTVEDHAGQEMRLRINDMSIQVEDRLVRADRAAEHLWRQFSAPLRQKG